MNALKGWIYSSLTISEVQTFFFFKVYFCVQVDVFFFFLIRVLRFFFLMSSLLHLKNIFEILRYLDRSRLMGQREYMYN